MQRDAERSPIYVCSENDRNGRICRIYCRIAVFIDYRIIRKYDFSGIPTGVVFDGKGACFAFGSGAYRNRVAVCASRYGKAYFQRSIVYDRNRSPACDRRGCTAYRKTRCGNSGRFEVRPLYGCRYGRVFFGNTRIGYRKRREFRTAVYLKGRMRYVIRIIIRRARIVCVLNGVSEKKLRRKYAFFRRNWDVLRKRCKRTARIRRIDRYGASVCSPVAVIELYFCLLYTSDAADEL